MRGPHSKPSPRFFETLNFDAITVAPYMGEDSVKPFLEYKNKWAIVLALTSNKGAHDFQTIMINAEIENQNYLYQEVIEKSMHWGTPENMMFVVGATRADMLTDVRTIIPEHFLLIPGVGTQGGSLQEVAKYGMNKHCGLLVNSSRGIIYASGGENYADKAKAETVALQKEMKQLLETIL